MTKKSSILFGTAFNEIVGIPNNPALPTTSITISSDVARQQDSTSPMTTVLSSFMPVPKIHKTLTDSRPEVVSKQALLDPDTKLPNVWCLRSNYSFDDDDDDSGGRKQWSC